VFVSPALQRGDSRRVAHPCITHHWKVPHPSLLSGEGWASTNLNRPVDCNGAALAVDSLSGTQSNAIRSRPFQADPSSNAGNSTIPGLAVFQPSQGAPPARGAAGKMPIEVGGIPPLNQRTIQGWGTLS
jgi:hypothetical protein